MSKVAKSRGAKPVKSAQRRAGASVDVEFLTKTKAVIDRVSAAIMMVDRDFIVTYANDTTKEMLTKNAEHFRAVWPSFDASKIIGSCIDMFHRNPAHQRQLLSNPANLPHRAEISVGPLKFSLMVTASYDLRGNYAGNVLEWADVTELRRQEAINTDYRGYFAAIDKAQAVIEFSLDGKVLTANENFLKVLGYTLDEIRGQHHSMFVDPDLSPERRIPAVLGEARPRQLRCRPVQTRSARAARSLDPGELQPDFRREGQAIQGGEIRYRHHRAEAAQRGLRGPACGDQQGAGGDRVRAWTARCCTANENFLERARLHAGRDPRPAPQHVRRSRPIATAPTTGCSGRSWGAASTMPDTVQADRQGRQRGVDPGQLQPDHGHERQAVQGREIRHRRHRAGSSLANS